MTRESSRYAALDIDFSGDGSHEMDQVNGDGPAELQPDGPLHGEICYQNGDEYPFFA